MTPSDLTDVMTTKMTPNVLIGWTTWPVGLLDYKHQVKLFNTYVKNAAQNVRIY